MKTRLISATLAASLFALALAAPVLADDGHGTPDPMVQSGGGGSDVLEPVLWSLAGVAIFAVGLGVLYLFKRQVGGFPENPDWVAPISIMRSRDLPIDTDDDPGHEAQAPAH